jgi:hypothetical protein
LSHFYGIDREKDKLIVKTLSETINQSSSKELRQAAAVALLGCSKVDGLREIIGKNRMDNESFFVDLYSLYSLLWDATGLDPSEARPDRLRRWWEENEERLVAEQAAADAAREKNQTDNGTSPKAE